MPVPDVVGQNFADAFGDPLLCYNVILAKAPDGHDILRDITTASSYKVASVSPAAGTVVPKDSPITLKLVAA